MQGSFSMFLNAQRNINKQGRTRLPSFLRPLRLPPPRPPAPPPPRSHPSPLPPELEISAASPPASHRTHTRGARGSVPGAEPIPSACIGIRRALGDQAGGARSKRSHPSSSRVLCESAYSLVLILSQISSPLGFFLRFWWADWAVKVVGRPGCYIWWLLSCSRDS
jgi:hypothetical protein